MANFLRYTAQRILTFSDVLSNAYGLYQIYSSAHVDFLRYTVQRIWTFSDTLSSAYGLSQIHCPAHMDFSNGLDAALNWTESPFAQAKIGSHMIIVRCIKYSQGCDEALYSCAQDTDFGMAKNSLVEVLTHTDVVDHSLGKARSH